MKAAAMLLALCGISAAQYMPPGGGGGSGASSVTGTANEILCSPTTGNVVCLLTSPVTFPGSATFPSGATFGVSGGSNWFGLYNEDGSEFVWNPAATGTTWTGTWSGVAPSNGQAFTASSCSGSPETCTLGWATPGATTNQNLRSWGGVLTPSSLTACVYVPFAGTITSFHAIAGDGATAVTVLVKIETQPTFATFVSTGVSGASDITNGGEQLTSVLGLADTTLTGWTTAFTAGTTICLVGSTFSAGTSVNANITLTAN